MSGSAGDQSFPLPALDPRAAPGTVRGWYASCTGQRGRGEKEKMGREGEAEGRLQSED